MTPRRWLIFITILGFSLLLLWFGLCQTRDWQEIEHYSSVLCLSCIGIE